MAFQDCFFGATREFERFVGACLSSTGIRVVERPRSRVNFDSINVRSRAADMVNSLWLKTLSLQGDTSHADEPYTPAGCLIRLTGERPDRDTTGYNRAGLQTWSD